MVKCIYNLDQVTTVKLFYKRESTDFKVILESKYFFNLFTKKKHIWAAPLTAVSDFSACTLPFTPESIQRILDETPDIMYDPKEEMFYDAPCALVWHSDGIITRFYFNTNAELDEFAKQFDKLNLVQ